LCPCQANVNAREPTRNETTPKTNNQSAVGEREGEGSRRRGRYSGYTGKKDQLLKSRTLILNILFLKKDYFKTKLLGLKLLI